MGNRYKFSVDFSGINEEVSGSCTQITIHRPNGKIGFLIDCGLYQGEENSNEKNYDSFKFNPQNINFTIVTHNHADHTGRIPFLYKSGYYGKIYTTEDTRKMLHLSLEDNEKIIGINAKKANHKPLYNFNDVENTLEKVISKEYEETFSPCEGVKCTFFKNAHLIGAAMVLVQISCEESEDINVFFTGDYKENNIFFKVPKLPEWVTKLPMHIMCESTYGYIDSTETNIPMFDENVLNWLKDGMNTILVPALSLGRFQEIAYKLKYLQENRLLDSNIPIRFDGNLAIKYTNMYKYSLQISENMREFMPENSSFVESTLRENVITYSSKQIIVTTSGMGSFGPAQEYIPRLIENKNVGIHFTSYVSPETMGYKLLNCEPNSFTTIGSVLKQKVAEVKTTSEFSSHAKRDELIQLLSQFNNIRTLFINHGETKTKESFAKYCKKNLSNCKDVAILGCGYTIRINSWGIVKSIYEKL